MQRYAQFWHFRKGSENSFSITFSAWWNHLKAFKPNVWYPPSLKILAIKRWFLFSFTKSLNSRHFVVGGSNNFKLLLEISSENGFQKIVLSSLLLFLCTCYYVDLGDIQWNEVTTSIARNFNNSWPLHLNSSYVINLYPNIWFIENSKCRQFSFWENSRKKKQIFQFLKSRYLVVSGPTDMNVGMFWETSVSFLKSVVSQLFPKYSQSYVNLSVKSSPKLKKF